MLTSNAALASPHIRVSDTLDASTATLWTTAQRRPLRRVPLQPQQDPAQAHATLPLSDIAAVWRELQCSSARDVDPSLELLLRRLCRLLDADVAHWSLSCTTRGGRHQPLAQFTWNDSLRVATPDGQRPTQGPALVCTRVVRNASMTLTLARAAGGADFSPHDQNALDLLLQGLDRWLNWLVLSHAPHASAGPLPPHQRKVLLLLVTGLSEKQIAAELNLSTNTAHQYVTAIYRRFGVRNRPSLAALWLGAEAA